MYHDHGCSYLFFHMLVSSNTFFRKLSANKEGTKAACGICVNAPF